MYPKPARSTLVRFTALFLLAALLVAGVSPALAQRDDPENIPPPTTVTIAGTIQTQLGCPGDWNTECEASMLAYDPDDDLWMATFELAAGAYEYKAALNGTWDDNYGLNAEYYGPNIPLEVASDGPVTFWYDHKTRWVSDNVNSLLANVPGNFQDEIGCPGEWAPDCLRTLLTDPDGDGIYTFVTADIPAGDYEAKVALNQSWEVNFGADGAQDGPNIPFTAEDGMAVAFVWDSDSGLMTIQSVEPGEAPAVVSAGGGMPAPAVAQPDLVVIPGTLQDEAGCPGEWQPDCESTALVFDEGTGVWSNTFSLPAGDYEYKVALNGTWDVNFGLNAQRGGANIPLSLAGDADVTFLFSTQTGWVTDNVNSPVVTAIGDFQTALGCPAADAPDCLGAWLQDPDGDGTFLFQTDRLPAGDYAARVAVGQSLDEVYGADGAAGGEPIPFTIATDGELANFIWDDESKVMAIRTGAAAGPAGNINEARAHWVAADTIAWDIDPGDDFTYRFHFSRTGGTLDQTLDDIQGGEVLELTRDPNGLPEDVIAKFPHLRDYQAFTIAPDDLRNVRIALKGQVAVSALDGTGLMVDATGLQIPGVLDDLYAYDGPLGVTYEDGVPTLRVWAPTAQLVRLALYDDSDAETRPQYESMRVDPDTGVWSITGDAAWDRKFYQYEVKVFAPAAGEVVTNLVTDPYSLSLSTNSARSQIVNLDDPDLKPDGWDETAQPGLAAPEDAVIYELHIRDFSSFDASVPEALRGTYGAFTVDSDGTRHLAQLAESGVNHLHLLPSFDIATINEVAAERVEADPAELAALPPDSEEQQAILGEIRDLDAFNWGYDPYHYNVPEGSYSSDPDGTARILEYRQMVQAVNRLGMRVVSDVVFNHTNASGQNDRSVLDKVVPGYYHRLDDAGRVTTSTCCQNTATEHDMMRKLMVDSVRLWVEQYHIGGFRFDLMGHHMKDDMLAVRAAVDAIDPSIFIYGEGWNFGEVANDQRGVNATQANLAGTGIGTFNDRLRDAARGGNPFGGQQEQGFVTGLYTDPNETDQGPEGAQVGRLLLFSDLVRVGLAGNLADYSFEGYAGEIVTGADVDYNGSPAGYTADPQENIVYVSKHDNETLFDAIQYKAPLTAGMDQRVRMQNLGNSIVMLSQGVPFFQAADDLLRSKSLDRNSYNSGDWFNAIDWSGQTTNWGHGLPPSADNQSMWPVMAELLGNPDLMPGPEHIAGAAAHFREMAQVRASSPLFRLRTAGDVQQRLRFHNTGPDQVRGLIVMSLSDVDGADLDPAHDRIVVVFNATPDEVAPALDETIGGGFALHPVLAASADPVVQGSTFDPATGTFTVPGRTTAVFVEAQSGGDAAGGAAEGGEAIVEVLPTPEAFATPEVSTGDAGADLLGEPAEETTAETAPASPAATNGALILGGILALGALAGLIAWSAERRKARESEE
jgi:pullulanase-type alpha-1,6-glucosidase